MKEGGREREGRKERERERGKEGRRERGKERKKVSNYFRLADSERSNLDL